MHIAFNGWFWDKPYVGSGQYLRQLIHTLKRVAPDLNMSLILPPDYQSPDQAPEGVPQGVPDGVPEGVNIITTKGSANKLGKLWFEQRTFPKLAGQVNADIAHIPYWATPLTSPVRLVTSILDVAPLIYPEYASSLGGKLYNALVRATSGGNAHVITLSEASKADIIQYLDIPPEQITPTHLGIDSRFHPKLNAENDDAVRQKYNLPEKFVLYMGGYDIRKNVKLLLEAYTFVAQSEDAVPLVLTGREPEWGKPVFPDMRSYAEQLGLNDHIIWLGHVDEDDKPALYRLASVFASPSAYEGFGLPVLEAMASGTPVVASDIPVYQETLGGGAFLVESPERMAGAIIALLLQDPLRDTMVNQGIAQTTRYQWRKTALATLNVYHQVMAL
jgi:glycosyltransferase involved in cell wall biosynthesis